METPIYLDYNATTPIHSKVVDAMLPYFSTHFGNPSSSHKLGQVAKAALERARVQVADVINASYDSVIFTSGGTESINMAFKGVVYGSESSRRQVIVSSVEHVAVLDTVRFLEKYVEGCTVSYVGVDERGIINLNQLEELLKSKDTCLLSIMLANNETGVIQPVREVVNICRRISEKTLDHTDASQCLGKIKVDIKHWASIC